MRADAAFSYTRDLLERITGTRPEPDHEGDLPIRLGGALFYARIMGDSESWVQVFSIAVDKIDDSADLAHTLNNINTHLRFARTFWTGSQVLFESDIWADDLNPSNLSHACRNIASATDIWSPQLITTFGGIPAFQQSQDSDYQHPEYSNPGFYI